MNETVVGPEAAPSQIGYSGVLSSSPEESLDHARQSVAAPNPGRNTFGAVMASTEPEAVAAPLHFEFDASAVGSDRCVDPPSALAV